MNFSRKLLAMMCHEFIFFAKTGFCTFCHFWTGLSLVILINLGFRQKTKFLKISVGFVKFAKWYKKPKWQDTQKSKKSRIAKITELAKLTFLSVKKVLILVPLCTVIYLVLIETLLYCIFYMYVNCVLTEHLAECERFKYFSKCKVVIV